MEGGRSMKKLLLVALFVAVPALVLAQGTTMPSKPETKAEAKKIEAKATETTKTEARKEATKQAKEVAKPTTETVTKKTEKATETTKTAATEVKAVTQPESILIGEIIDVNDTNKFFTLKVKETGKLEKISYKSRDPLTKNKMKVRAILEKDNAGNWTVKKLEEHKY